MTGKLPGPRAEKLNLNNKYKPDTDLCDLSEPSGQVRFDDRGNAVWETSRHQRLEHPALALAEEQAPRDTLKTNGGGLKTGYNPYDSGTLPKATRRRNKDLRALSKWIEVMQGRRDTAEE